jgi:hypothetical protein
MFCDDCYETDTWLDLGFGWRFCENCKLKEDCRRCGLEMAHGCLGICNECETNNDPTVICINCGVKCDSCKKIWCIRCGKRCNCLKFAIGTNENASHDVIADG